MLRLTQTSLRELQLGLRVCETCFKRDFGVQSRILDDRCGFSSWWCKNLNVTKSRFLWFFTIGPSLRSSSFNSREENPSLVPKLWRTKIWQLFWFLAFLALFGTRGVGIYVKTGGTHVADMAVWLASNPPNCQNPPNSWNSWWSKSWTFLRPKIWKFWDAWKSVRWKFWDILDLWLP